MKTPSRKILSLVLGEEYKPRLHEWHSIEDNILSTYYDCGSYDEYNRPTGLGMEINLDTLTRLMKEWALEQGYMYEIYSRTWEVSKITVCLKNGKAKCFHEETELDAVYQATEWIVNEEGFLDE